ncbi:MAG: 7-carboxy-7-deazaguanine synthase QueE [Streptosporangiaceae bacterium]
MAGRLASTLARSALPVAGPGELLVSEVFGPTFQGEGRSLGQRVGFVRLGTCNLDCGRGPGSTWACDTAYTWDWERYSPAAELAVRAVADIVAELTAMDVDRIVITGGEPLIQQHRLVSLLRAAAQRGWAAEIETNGTISPLPEVAELVSQFNVSPKVRGSGVPAETALRPRALAAFQDSGKAIFKFVASGAAELDDIGEVVARWRLSPVMIMPAGTAADEMADVARELAEPVLARGWDLTIRLHVLLWGNERAR